MRHAGSERIAMRTSTTHPSCSAERLRARMGAPFPPTLVDVRRQAAFERDPVRLPMALRREPDALGTWASELDSWRTVVAYCVHGHEVSQAVASALRARGYDAEVLEGGLERWRDCGLPVEPSAPPTRWVTRARPKIDRIACPWLVRRFVDASAEIHYVPAETVRSFAAAHHATPFDIPGVEYGHAGERCSFDAFVARHAANDAALRNMADIVRAADTDTLDHAAQAAGLLAVSLGLGRGLTDDASLLRHGLMVYDALYAWCREVRAEKDASNPASLPS
jgi:rhodanese-related sulfurtransferase